MNSKLIIILLFCCTTPLLMSTPPDKPLTPKEWSKLCGNGSWMIFREAIPGGKNNKKMRVPPTAKTFTNLKRLGITGGRLQINDSTGVAIDNKTGLLKEEVLNAIEKVVDTVLSNNMTIMMQVNFEMDKNEKNAIFENDRNGDEWVEKHKIKSNEERIARMKRVIFINVVGAVKRWEQLCKRLANKSHRLAMCPVVESHLFEEDWLKLRDKLQLDDKMQWLPKGVDSLAAYRAYLDKCTKIFRKYNPTRIIGHKGYASSRGHGVPESAEKTYLSKAQLAAFNKKKKKTNEASEGTETLMPNSFDKLKWPIGGDPAPNTGKPIYYLAILSASAPYGPWWDWDKNSEFTNEEIIQGASLRFKFIDKWRKKTGIQVFSDHWLPTRHNDNVNYDKMPAKLRDRFKKKIAQGKMPPPLSLKQSIKAVEWNYRLYKKYKIPNSGPRPDYFLKSDGTLKTDEKEGLMWINAALKGNGRPLINKSF